MYVRVFREALARGLEFILTCKCFIQFGSVEVRQYCEERATSTCSATSAQISSSRVAALVLMRSRGKHFQAAGCHQRAESKLSGRSGPGQMYLASPYTVAASAIAGRIVEYQPVSAASAK